MKILGIASGHDAGAAVVEDGRVLTAVNEERLNRKKLYWGSPFLAIEECLRLAKIKPQEIDRIAFANLTAGGGIQREFRAGKLTWKKKLLDFFSYSRLMDKKITQKVYLTIFGRLRDESETLEFLEKIRVKAPVEYFEHHFCHAASAYYTSPFNLEDKVLIVTTDGSGDGLCATISIVDEKGILQRQNETVFYHSPASSFYSNVTYNLGFIPLRHEGKITGLAAYGKTDKTLPIFKKFLKVNFKSLEYRSNLGCYGRPAARKLHLLFQGYKREDIAAGLQKAIEDAGSILIQKAAQKYNCDKVCLAGGLFANVRLNQVILELPEIKDVYIHPHMGDGGVAVGVALALWAKENERIGKVIAPQKLNHVYLGPEFNNEEIELALEENNLDYAHLENIEEEIARLLVQGKVVARFNGKMEYGPRALGNRSILCRATDPLVNDWLNKRLQRTEFMPFAPIILFEEAVNYFQNFDPSNSFASEFMTITYQVTEKCKKEAPAIVHLDGTARPQIVRKEINPSAYKILKEYQKLTGLSVLVNTSFNMHEEPIVCTPADAIRAFRIGQLDALAIGNYIVTNN